MMFGKRGGKFSWGIRDHTGQEISRTHKKKTRRGKLKKERRENVSGIPRKNINHGRNLKRLPQRLYGET